MWGCGSWQWCPIDIGVTRGVPAGGDDGEPHGISNLARAVIAEQAASAAREAGDAPSLPCEAPCGPRHLSHDAEHCTITARCLIVLLKTLGGVSHGLDAVGVTPEMWVLRVHGITLQCGAVSACKGDPQQWCPVEIGLTRGVPAGDESAALRDMEPCWYHVHVHEKRARAAAAAASSAATQRADAATTDTALPTPGELFVGVSPAAPAMNPSAACGLRVATLSVRN